MASDYEGRLIFIILPFRKKCRFFSVMNKIAPVLVENHAVSKFQLNLALEITVVLISQWDNLLRGHFLETSFGNCRRGTVSLSAVPAGSKKLS